MFRVPDLLNKVLFTIFIIAIFRFGSHVPVPYIDFHAILELKKSAANGSGGTVGLPGSLLRRRVDEFRGIRARDHALHHRVDHHAAARGCDPQTGGMAGRRSDRAEEDHAVDALPHRAIVVMQSTALVFV